MPVCSPLTYLVFFRDLHKAVPQSQGQQAEVMDGTRKVRCYPLKLKVNIIDKVVKLCLQETGGWCATCIEGARQGEPGYCLEGHDNITDYDYEHMVKEDSSHIAHDKAWGFCDPKCYAKLEQLHAMDLQEVLQL